MASVTVTAPPKGSAGESKTSTIFRQSTDASFMPHTREALTVVVLGASGDLAKKKTYPSLFKLYLKGYLPEHTSIILPLPLHRRIVSRKVPPGARASLPLKATTARTARAALPS